jgi:transposase
MARARKRGKRPEKPRVLDGEWERVRPLVAHGAMSERQAAKILGVGRSTIEGAMTRDDGVPEASKRLSR